MAKVLLRNTDSMPVQIDAAGRSLGTGEQDRLDVRDEVVAAAIRDGLLVRVSEAPKPPITEPAAGSKTTED